MDNRGKVAYNLVREALTAAFGPDGEGWETFKCEAGKTAIRLKA